MGPANFLLKGLQHGVLAATENPAPGFRVTDRLICRIMRVGNVLRVHYKSPINLSDYPRQDCREDGLRRVAPANR